MQSMQALSATGSCLANVPTTDPLEINYANKFLAGQVFSLNDQCKMLYGPTASNCAVNENYSLQKSISQLFKIQLILN